MVISAGDVCDDITLEEEEFVSRWNYVGYLLDLI